MKQPNFGINFRDDATTKAFRRYNAISLRMPIKKHNIHFLTSAITYCKNVDNCFVKELLERAGTDLMTKFMSAKTWKERNQIVSEAACRFNIQMVL